MAKPPTTNVQLAVACLAAMLFANLLGAAVGFARLHAMSNELIGVNSMIVVVGVFALPTTWWGFRTGYICGVLIAALNVAGNLAAFVQGVPTSGAMPPVLVLIPIFQTVFAVPFLVFALRAWRETAKPSVGSTST